MLVPSTFTGRYKNKITRTAIRTDSIRSPNHATVAIKVDRDCSAAWPVALWAGTLTSGTGSFISEVTYSLQGAASPRHMHISALAPIWTSKWRFWLPAYPAGTLANLASATDFAGVPARREASLLPLHRANIPEQSNTNTPAPQSPHSLLHRPDPESLRPELPLPPQPP